MSEIINLEIENPEKDNIENIEKENLENISLKMDTDARNKIVSDIDKSFFVEAGAGSGKTTMLVNRMVAMVEAGIDIDKICAITFTKAAAGEFYERFQNLLIERSRTNYEWKDEGHAGQLPEPTKESRDKCKEALENIDNDLEEAGQMAAEADNADAKAAVKDAKAKAVDAKNAYKKGQYCKAYDQFNEAYALIADSYADDAKMYADGANSDAASQAAEDADLYAEAAHNDGLDCAMAAGRNARINSEIARDADKKAKKDRAAYNDPKFANTLAQEALTMADKSRSNAAKTDAKDASGKAYRGNCADSYAAAAKSFAESADAFAAKSKNNPEAKAAAAEANRYAQEAAEAARMGDVIAAYSAATKARDAAVRARRIAFNEPTPVYEKNVPATGNTSAANTPADRRQVQALLDMINATVNFDFAGTEPKFGAATDLAINTLCKAMAADKNLKVRVTGHTDDRGTEAGNMRYGQKRAEALKTLMVQRGAPAANISTDSKGQNEPVVDNDTDEHRYQNRRAVITIQ